MRVEPQPSRTGVLRRREGTQKQRCKGECQALTEAEIAETSTSEGMATNAGNQQNIGRGKGGLSPRACRGTTALLVLHFELLAFRTMKEYISDVLSPLIWDTLLS